MQASCHKKNMKTWPKVVELCDLSYTFDTNLVPLNNLTKCIPFLSPRNVKSLHFRPFTQNVVNAKFDQRDSHGKLRNCHVKILGKIMQNSALPTGLVIWGHLTDRKQYVIEGGLRGDRLWTKSGKVRII